MEESLIASVLQLVISLFDDVQKTIDQSCHDIGWLWLHLVIFSICQVLAILNGYQSHANGTVDASYTWWWVLQDIFHLGGGMVLLLAAMGVFCVVTSFFQALPRQYVRILNSVGCPACHQASAASMLMVRPLGMHVCFGYFYMDIPKAVGFFFVLFVFIMNHMLYIANSINHP